MPKQSALPELEARRIVEHFYRANSIHKFKVQVLIIVLIATANS